MYTSLIRRESTRQESAELFLNPTYRSGEGGGKSLLSVPGSELLLGRKKGKGEKENANTIDAMRKNKNDCNYDVCRIHSLRIYNHLTRK